MCASGARSTGPQVSTCAGGAPMIEQPAVAGEIDQPTPVPLGSGSLIRTPTAVPSPLFVAVMVNPICSPAFTVASSAVLTSDTSGQSTVVDALACRVGALDDVNVATFGYVAQLANEVPLTTCAVTVPVLLAMIVKPIGEPATTVAASSVFVSVSAAHCTVVVAESPGTFGSFVTVTLAVLSYALQLAEVVALVTCTVRSAPDARVVGPQTST